MKRKICTITTCIALLLVTACGNASPETTTEATTTATTEETVSTPTDPYEDMNMDDIAIDIVKEASQARWDKCDERQDDFNYISDHVIMVLGELYGEYHWYKEIIIELNQTEYDVICKYTNDNFKDRNFEDETLKEYMIEYADAVEKQLESSKITDFSVIDQNNDYSEIAQDKCTIILKIMDEYGLSFDNKYVTHVKELEEPLATIGDAD